jgi:hypothetical protein
MMTLSNLQTELDQHLAEAATLLKQIVEIYPSTGGDADNYARIALESAMSHAGLLR